ncbi:MAG TPA: molybdate ABC transporter substrate-binding protein [Hyphomicrobiales bacterium]|nr:molybdate ABC transporter substrate-binding protein [Hyphomicrobiales bacterium]
MWQASLRRFSLVTCVLFAATFPAESGRAGEVNVAVAANFTAAANEVAAAFKEKTGHDAVLVFGSSGKLFAQIANDAPFGVFLSADVARPEKAEAEGLAVAGSRFTYAIGKLALYSAKAGVVDAGGKVLSAGSFERLAIANPDTAPYGAAAMEVLGALGLAETLAPKLVRGDNIAQTMQFVATGNAEIGFVALAQVIGLDGGSRWIVPEDLYRPIRQDAVLLKKGEANPAATAFVDFLESEDGRAIVERFGYGLD